jgi:hypothetical protein
LLAIGDIGDQSDHREPLVAQAGSHCLDLVFVPR